MKHYSIDELIDLQEKLNTVPSELNEHLHNCKGCRHNWDQLQTCREIWDDSAKESTIHHKLWQNITKEINGSDQSLETFNTNTTKKRRKLPLLTYINFTVALAAGLLLFFNTEFIFKLTETKKYLTFFNSTVITRTNESLSWLNVKITELNFNLK